jgi:hypothetical protein
MGKRMMQHARNKGIRKARRAAYDLLWLGCDPSKTRAKRFADTGVEDTQACAFAVLRGYNDVLMDIATFVLPVLAVAVL